MASSGHEGPHGTLQRGEEIIYTFIQLADNLCSIDSNWVPAQQEAGKDSASLTSSRLDKLSQHPDVKYWRDMEKAISNVGGTAYVGGFETVSGHMSPVHGLFSACTCRPRRL